VDIVKTYLDFKIEIKDVFNIIDKYDSNYQETLDRVSFLSLNEYPAILNLFFFQFVSSGNALFKQLSINECIENLIKDFI
jgi:hypothetical protein